MRIFAVASLLLACLSVGLKANGQSADEALLSAVESADLPAVKASLDAGASASAATDQGASALFIAVQKKAPDIVQLLLDRGADVNAANAANIGATPLMWAIGTRDATIVNALLEADADVNIADVNGDPAINWAAYYGYSDMAALLLQRGADVSLTGHGNAREIAMRRGHQDLVKLLISHGGSQVPSPDVALMVEAIAAADTDGVREALSLGVSPDAVDFTGRPILAMAARASETAVVEQLVMAGAQIDLVDEIGFTALMEAARDGRFDTAALLLEAGADPNHRAGENALNLTPMHMAALSGDPAIVTLLAEAGAAIDPLGRKKATPLSWCLGEGKIEAALTLLDLGADPFIKSEYGYTPADIVESMDHEALKQKVAAARGQ